jgi:cytoskeletal protein CcmA (bactofilin family)
MALFEKKEENGEVPVSRGDKLNTIIGKDSVFNGKLEVNGTLRVDGTVKGEINCSDTVSIGGTGVVEASVQTKNAVISGTIRGNIHASEKIELQAKSVIHGDIVTKALAIEQGAVFEGHCNMGQNQPPAATPISTSATPTPKETNSSADKKR